MCALLQGFRIEPDAANLDDSVARCAQLVSFEHRDILGYYGHLDNADINSLVSELSKLNESDFIHLRIHWLGVIAVVTRRFAYPRMTRYAINYQVQSNAIPSQT